ncbi:hypothetical protein COJ96_05830 [Bacillus sp. AFS073361]|nr:hypothetical protein COJ96_05830 [Bacillus sp. AFS073361]
MTKVDHTGRQFGRLTAIRKVIINNRGHYVCRCECGNERIIRGDSLVGGKSKSCGCLSPDVNQEVHKTHGDSATRLYNIYHKMISRCYHKENDRFHRYGQRGISICNEWLNDYESFKEWSLSNGYTDDLSIDRINNDGNYEPSNCRWTTVIVQSNNTSRTRKIEFNGEIKSISEWCRELNYSYGTTRKLLKQGHKTPDEIFTRPRLGKGYTGTR